MKMIPTRRDILSAPTRKIAEKATEQAAKHMETWADILDYLDWNQVNELQTTNEVTDKIPSEYVCKVRERVTHLLITKWEMRKRYEICQKAYNNMIDEVMSNHAGIDFDTEGAQMGVGMFLKVR
jgi:hypothetical protein